MALSTRQLLYAKVKSLLQDISQANGYNTSPTVVDNHEDAYAAQEQSALYVKIGNETVIEGYIGQKLKLKLEVLVFALVRDMGGDTLADANLLLQDVRNAIFGNRASFGSACDGASLDLPGMCETDEGVLSQVQKSFFMQPLAFEYIAGPAF